LPIWIASFLRDHFISDFATSSEYIAQLAVPALVQRQDGCQAAVDGGRLEATRYLAVDELVDNAKGDLGWWAVAGQGGELVEIVRVVPPGAGGGVAAANPVDEVFDLG